MSEFFPQPASSGFVLKDFFLSQMPLGVLRSLEQDLPGVYASTLAASESEAGDLFGLRAWPVLREAAINEYVLKVLGPRHAGEGVEVIQTNNSRSTHPFCIIQAGSALMSIHCVHGHLEVPRHAHWRNALAAWVHQGHLFNPYGGESITQELTPNNPIYGHFLHLPSVGAGSPRPWGTYVQFPNENADAYVPGALIDVPTVVSAGPPPGDAPDFGTAIPA